MDPKKALLLSILGDQIISNILKGQRALCEPTNLDKEISIASILDTIQEVIIKPYSKDDLKQPNAANDISSIPEQFADILAAIKAKQEAEKESTKTEVNLLDAFTNYFDNTSHGIKFNKTNCIDSVSELWSDEIQMYVVPMVNNAFNAFVAGYNLK